MATLGAVVLAVIVVVTVLTSNGTPANQHGSGLAVAPPSHAVSVAQPSGGTAVDASRFESGACVSFAPTAGDNHHTVFIDAGHGGIDPGAEGETQSGRTIYEADQTLPVEMDTTALLRADGYRVVVSRTRDSNVARLGPEDVTGGALTPQGVHDDVAARDLCADLAKATVLLGIYFDAGTSPSNAGCITGYDTARPFSDKSHRLASLVQRDVLTHMNAHGWQIPDDGVATDTTLGGPALTTASATYGHLLLLGPAEPGWFTTPSRMPGALIEPLYVTDPFEGSIADSATGHQAIAAGMAQAIEQYFRAGS